MGLKKKGQIIKERLIEIGRKQMLEASYDSVGIRSITEEAQLPKAGFYYYFSSKEEFGKELFRDYMLSYQALHEKYLDKNRQEGTTAMQRIEMLYQKFYDGHRKNKWRVPCLFVKIAVEVNSKSEAIRKVIQEGIERIIVLHEQVIREGLEDGSLQIPEAFTVETFAELIFNQWKGAVLLSDLQRSSQALDRFFVFLSTMCRCRCPEIPEESA
ncbi:TetR/AcrR family transcriptional regulator [Candidatus Haliotispira prima]|uniref:TetR/AcrR family transcriptional regulator n=1 Tax=Candidatus Haliotispira prima TaxID=3034016 RepID=A0ABY8MIC8_9SPIO|nr:TetR/AcrR family transcriptional regulator [Candidatus Haliotispira prima]